MIVSVAIKVNSEINEISEFAALIDNGNSDIKCLPKFHCLISEENPFESQHLIVPKKFLAKNFAQFICLNGCAPDYHTKDSFVNLEIAACAYERDVKSHLKNLKGFSDIIKFVRTIDLNPNLAEFFDFKKNTILDNAVNITSYLRNSGYGLRFS